MSADSLVRRARLKAARMLSGSGGRETGFVVSVSDEGQELWSAVDRYVGERLPAPDPALDAAVAASRAGGLPEIAVSARQGKMLELLARVHGARRILEIGTLGGYSTICFARALAPGGRLVTLERDPHFAEVACANIAAAGFAQLVEIRVGPALETLPALADGEPFDLIFIDADKRNYPGYLAWALRLSRPGTAIVADNVVRDGSIVTLDEPDPRGDEEGRQGILRFYELLGREPRLLATAIQTVGEKGHDGFALALVTGEREG